MLQESPSAIPSDRPILALGADLKNAITLVVDGQAFVSQHIGDLDHYQSFCAFRETIQDLLSMYEVEGKNCWSFTIRIRNIFRRSTRWNFPSSEKYAVQHHRAHVASVLAERGAWDERVIGVSFDGTGYGDDGTIWGGEIFSGSVRGGFQRVAHLRAASLPGGDAAATCPAQAAAGFLSQLTNPPDFTAPPFSFPARYRDSLRLLRTNVRCFATTSMGRLFDTAAALLGFTREVTFEGQAAMWLERLAGHSLATHAYPFPFAGDELDFRPLLAAMVDDRMRGHDPSEIARAFQRGIANGVGEALLTLAHAGGTGTIVLSRRRIPERNASVRPEASPGIARFEDLDEPRRPPGRWRNQPRTSGVGGAGENQIERNALRG